MPNKQTNGRGGNFTLSGRESARLLSISPYTFYEWRKRFEDFPQPNPAGLFNAEDLRAFQDSHPDLGQGKSNKVTGAREVAMTENIEKRNILLDLQIAEAEGRVVPGDKVVEYFVRERTLILESLRKRLLSEIPAEAAGKQPGKIAQLLRDALDEFSEDAEKQIGRLFGLA